MVVIYIMLAIYVPIALTYQAINTACPAIAYSHGYEHRAKSCPDLAIQATICIWFLLFGAMAAFCTSEERDSPFVRFGAVLVKVIPCIWAIVVLLAFLDALLP